MIIITTEYDCNVDNSDKIIELLKGIAFFAANHPSYCLNFNIGYLPGDRTKFFLYKEFRSQQQFDKFIRTKEWINFRDKISHHIMNEEQKRWDKVTIRPGIMTG